MPSYRTGEVVKLLEARRGLQRVEVDLGAGPERAYALSQLTGPVALGDRVVVNTTAVELGLGTGGWHVVHWNLERDRWSEAGPGHIIKRRSRKSSRSTACPWSPPRCTASSRRSPPPSVRRGPTSALRT